MLPYDYPIVQDPTSKSNLGTLENQEAQIR